MTLKQSKNRLVNPAKCRKLTELEPDELRNKRLFPFQGLEPVGEFGEMFLICRLSNEDRRKLQVDFNNPGIVAVIQ